MEESKKKLAKDLEALQRQVEELTAANDKLEKSKKKIAAELEDANIDLEAQRSKVSKISKTTLSKKVEVGLTHTTNIRKPLRNM